WQGGERELGVNEAGTFAFAPAPSQASLPTSDDEPSAPNKRSPKQKKKPTSNPIETKDTPDDTEGSWQKLVETGQHDAAFEALQSSGGDVRNEVNQLMLAADAARLSGHPKDAVVYLERVVEQHSSDARAPVAAFTLGNMYMRALRDRQKATEMFQKTRQLAPEGPLAGDALAREVEAWARLGNADRARALAVEYLREYPKGSQVSAVKRFGDLE
ncbi:MAG: hypothetical protein AAF658_18125, partial [Myxococcota bacterium]